MIAAAVLGVLGTTPALPDDHVARPSLRGNADLTPSQLSAQSRAEVRRASTRIHVRPGGRLLYRDCKFWLAQEFRPSGTVIVPRQYCWWVRG